MRFLLILVASVAFAQTAPPQSVPQAAKPKPAAKTQAAGRTSAKPAAPKAAPMTDEQKTIYALGLSLYRYIGSFDLSPAEMAIVERALSDAAAHKPAIDLDEWGPKIQAWAQARTAKESAGFLARAANQPGAIKTPSGLIYRDITPGTGPSPTPADTVKVNYRGTFIDGAEFDSSYKRNQPAEFVLNRVIPCWTEGVQRMKVGGKAELVCPAAIAYGDQGRPGIPPGSVLVFNIELLGISSAPAAPPK